ncbi:hypothetical protein AX774_g6716 [Zancudomyces culisetae]|uniref:Uncharacterized protein n=1 Tax=Zancudomyces culisetae TaxID=1213189 RepID=A0A1R1PFV3_ZANCU|nr:hypothetical protein AX774_g6716 [Zancudomyces culisetae]|eukprot:OMH79851.1 hypothetical protein AX774_g6716 [Zancudomyces culisetae]
MLYLGRQFIHSNTSVHIPHHHQVFTSAHQHLTHQTLVIQIVQLNFNFSGSFKTDYLYLFQVWNHQVISAFIKTRYIPVITNHHSESPPCLIPQICLYHFSTCYYFFFFFV